MSRVSLKGKSFHQSIDIRPDGEEEEEEEGLIRRLRKQELVNRHGKKLQRKNRLTTPVLSRNKQEDVYPMLIDYVWMEEKYQREIADANRLVNEDLAKLFQMDYFQLVWGRIGSSSRLLPEYVSFGGSLIVDTSPPIFSTQQMMDSLSEEL